MDIFLDSVKNLNEVFKKFFDDDSQLICERQAVKKLFETIVKQIYRFPDCYNEELFCASRTALFLIHEECNNKKKQRIIKNVISHLGFEEEYKLLK